MQDWMKVSVAITEIMSDYNDLGDRLLFHRDHYHNLPAISIDCSDVFDLGGSDSEIIEVEDLEDLRNALEEGGYVFGFTLFCARKRNERPHNKYMEYVSEHNIRAHKLLLECGI